MDALIWFAIFVVALVAASWSITKQFPWPIRGLIGVSVIAVVVSWSIFRYPVDEYLVLAILFSILVGAAEIISRYRDEPFAALLENGHGPLYLAINGLVGAAAFGLLSRYGNAILSGIGSDPLLRAIAAGFGSPFIMRSKLFTLHTATGEDLGVGPDAVISILLRSVDRGIDRSRSARRLRLVFEECAHIPAREVSRAISFMRTAIASFQNLSEAEKRDFDHIVEAIQREYPNTQLTLMAICFAFLNLSGEANFRALMDDLLTYLGIQK